MLGSTWRGSVRRSLSATALALVVLAAGTSVDVRAQASPLIDAATLFGMRNDPALVLLHVGPKPAYDSAHISGARFVNLDEFGTNDGLSLELPPAELLRERLQQLGIGDDSKIVVVFGSGWVSPATRVLWTLQVAGVGRQTRLLDGGLRAWTRLEYPVTTDVPPPARVARLTAGADRTHLVDAPWMQAHAAAQGVRLVDARSPVFFEGPGRQEAGRSMPAGHIPGAVNIPYNSLWVEGGQILGVDSLRAIFRAAGVQPGDTVAAYCHIGQQGTVVLLAARVLGHPIRFYDGSMDDWNKRQLPLENARAPR